MDIAIVIPARQASKRFPGKPLAPLRAPDGAVRPLVEWCWRAATAAQGEARVIVATDDERIAECVAGFGGRAVLTDPRLRNGTERCAAALEALQREPELVVNWQGDNPLVPAAMVEALLALFADQAVEVATPYVTVDAGMQQRMAAEREAGLVGGTCVVTDSAGRALYFSKHPIPHGAGGEVPLKLHVGLYAYRPSALRAYCSHPPSAAESAEGLEQLRFLDMGLAVHMAEVALPPGGLWEVNNPSDVAVVEALLPRENGRG